MKNNIGGVERSIRLTTGLTAILLGTFGRLGRRQRIALLTLGGVGLATGLTGYCPANELVGRDTSGQSQVNVAERTPMEQQHFAE